MGNEVLELRAWAEEQAEHERHRRARPRPAAHRPRCGGRSRSATASASAPRKCPFGEECFAERASEKAAPLPADRHQPLAARDRRDRGRADDPRLRRGGHRRGPRAGPPGSPRPPPTSCPLPEVDRAARRSRSGTSTGTEADDLADAGDALRDGDRRLPARPVRHAARARSPTRWCWSATPRGPALGVPQGVATPARPTPAAPRPGARCRRSSPPPSGWPPTPRPTCSGWPSATGDRGGDRLCVAPLQVWGPMRDKLLTDKTVVMTTATLMLGGDFDALATSVGLKPGRAGRPLAVGPTGRDDAGRAVPTTTCCRGAASTSARRSTTASRRSSTSPATCRRPGRDGLGAGPARRDRRPGRRRRRPHARAVLQPPGRRDRGRGGPRAAAAPDHLAQGDAQLPELARQFVEDPHTCLFGTLSLWQGLDVPGDTCQLVLIDRIPFPRPDDPLMSRAPARGRPGRRQRLHAGRRRPTPRCCSPRAPAG